MSNNKPSLPQGTRDFGPETVRKRKYILDTIRNIFELYGYQPLETPAMEQLDTLMGKYGEEGDSKLIFEDPQQRSERPKKTSIKPAPPSKKSCCLKKRQRDLTERALRYDLTIPFARYVAMNHGQLNFPFNRYQIQPVWRADRPQKGRYREFYQCDADVVGSYSLLNEVELAAIYRTAFEKLGIPVEIKINNRKILAALAEVCGGADKMTDITVAIDKLDKIGLEKVKAVLAERGLDPSRIELIENYLMISGDNQHKLSRLKSFFSEGSIGIAGVQELSRILDYPGIPPLVIDPTLARGLNYYTGTIFEVKATGVQMGSIGGGGRYDDLTGTFGVPGIPGVGISFGVDRIYDVMEELKGFPADVHTGTKILFFNLGETESRAAFGLLQQLRDRGISAELYHEQAKFDRQFKYAEKKGIPLVVIIGSEELASKTAKLKDLRDGSQKELPFEQITRPDLFR